MFILKSKFSNNQIKSLSYRYLRSILFSFLLLFITSCSTYQVIHITNNNQGTFKNKTGFYYALPQTVLKVDVTIRKAFMNKGPYAEYAEKYLGLTNIIRHDEVEYDIMSVKISSFSQRDPEQYYFVSTPPHQHLYVSFNEDGSLQSINSKLKNEPEEGNIPLNEQSVTKSSNNSQYIYNDNLSEKIDTIVEKVKSDTLVIEKKIFRKVYTEKSSDERAKDAADYLMKLKENRFNVITGYAEVPYSRAATKYMNDQLEKTINEYLSLFTGDTTYEVMKYSFIYVPDKSDISKVTSLFAFSPKEGIIRNTSTPGEVVTITVDKKDISNRLGGFQSSLDTPAAKRDGFFYRIPAYAKITIKLGDKILAENELLINQFGVISHLPLNTKKVVFYPNSAALKHIAE